MSWHLYGSGCRTREQWSDLLASDDSWTASWADHLGFHEESLPAEAPRTTHIWAWARHAWLRVRIDDDHWWAALLVEGEQRDDPRWTSSEEIETPDITGFTNWGNTRNVKQYRWAPGARNALHRSDMIQLIPSRVTTATFIGDTATR